MIVTLTLELISCQDCPYLILGMDGSPSACAKHCKLRFLENFDIPGWCPLKSDNIQS